MITPPEYRSVRHFARCLLRDGCMPIVPGDLHWSAPGVGEAVIYRDRRWQVEMVVVAPHTEIRRHRHNRCDSVEIAVAGQVDIVIGERRHCIAAASLRGPVGAHLLPVPRGEWHHGKALEQGSIYLSFQQWDGELALITEDWEE